jgi:hypothetical protein
MVALFEQINRTLGIDVARIITGVAQVPGGRS